MYPNQQQSELEPATLDQPKISVWHRYRIIILAAGLLVVVGATSLLLVSYHSKTVTSNVVVASPKPASPVSKPANGNVWHGPPVADTSIPLGDGKVASSPQVGYIDSCTTNFRGGGARHAGSWINTSTGTWNAETKIAVEGSNTWPAADYSNSISGDRRIISTNDLPENYPTGNFPISRSDPAYQFDTNPNHIATQSLSYSLPINPTAAASISCLPLGAIGVLNDGVLLFDALDDAGRDAVAHETQDLCNGHPNGQEMYHYHNVPSCIRDKATGSSTLVGYALDGYGIYVERDANGNLPTNADLDVCHGRTSQVDWDGKMTNIYHYDVTLEYPYTVGCFHGTSVRLLG